MNSGNIYEYQCIPATKQSLAQRKLVYGIGVNDATYMVNQLIRGKQVICPFYRVWRGILQRCYSPKRQAVFPTYIGCSVAPEWISFMTFRAWMESKNWRGLQIDKDILIPGNKIYGPDTCAFVDGATNTVLLDSASIRGEHPIGVCLDKNSNKFLSYCKVEGRLARLGSYDTPEEAHNAWRKRKSAVIQKCALRQPDIRVRDALLTRASDLNRNNSKYEKDYE